MTCVFGVAVLIIMQQILYNTYLFDKYIIITFCPALQ